MWANEFVERTMLNVILTMPCCGKSYLHNLNTKYFDLDIFNNQKTVGQKKVALKMLKYFALNCDESCVYLLNICTYRNLMLFNDKNILVKEIIIPKDLDFRCQAYCNRDLEDFGVVRIKGLELFKKKYGIDTEYGQSLARKLGIKLTWLKDGNFLSDYLLDKKEVVTDFL